MRQTSADRKRAAAEAQERAETALKNMSKTLKHARKQLQQRKP